MLEIMPIMLNYAGYAKIMPSYAIMLSYANYASYARGEGGGRWRAATSHLSPGVRPDNSRPKKCTRNHVHDSNT